MKKAKYVMRKQDLYKQVSGDAIFGNIVNNFQKNQLQKKDHPQDITIKEQITIIQQPDHKENIPLTQKNEFCIIKNSQRLKGNMNFALKQKDFNKTIPKKSTVPINFSSSLKSSNHKRSQTSNTKISIKSKSREKSREIMPTTKIAKISDKNITFSNQNKETQNHTARTSYVHKQIEDLIPQIKHAQIKYNQQQKVGKDSLLFAKVQINEIGKQKEMNEMQTRKIQTQNLISLEYQRQTEIKLDQLQMQLHIRQVQNKELQIALKARDVKLDQKQREAILLYKQNKDLSDMLRDLEKLMEKKSIQSEKQILFAESKLKEKEDLYKILEAERDTLLRKKERQHEEIQKLNQTIKIKDAQAMSLKQKQEFLLEQNTQIISAYAKMKLQLEQALKINETQRFFKQMVQKGQQQTSRTNNMSIQKFRCQKCNQVIYGSESTMDDLAQYHLNQKFKNHIKTYENEIKFWKEQIQFMKTQHQHEIENIRTVLQCTFQKTLLGKEQKCNEKVNQLREKILIQEDLIRNYKSVIERKGKTQLKSTNGTGIQSICHAGFQNIQTSRSNEYQTRRNYSQTERDRFIKTSRNRDFLNDSIHARDVTKNSPFQNFSSSLQNSKIQKIYTFNTEQNFNSRCLDVQ